jgi:hypothetical protein
MYALLYPLEEFQVAFERLTEPGRRAARSSSKSPS